MVLKPRITYQSFDPIINEPMRGWLMVWPMLLRYYHTNLDMHN